MTQNIKKAANSNPAKEIREVTLKAVENSKHATESVITSSGEAIKDLMANGATEARKAQEKIIEFSRDSMENISEYSETAGSIMNEFMNISREQMEAFTDFSAIAARIMKDAGSDAFNIANSTLSRNIETSKDFFQLKTFADFVEFNNRMYRENIDGMFKAGSRMSDYGFQFATEAMEPFSSKAHDTMERIFRSMK